MSVLEGKKESGVWSCSQNSAGVDLRVLIIGVIFGEVQCLITRVDEVSKKDRVSHRYEQYRRRKKDN